MADVEKVARAIDPDAFSYTSDVDGSLVAILRRDNAMKAAQRALAAMGEPPHLCGHAQIQSYTGQVELVPPPQIARDDGRGICVDVCLALEITELWRHGIRTTGCCCGHGEGEPWHPYIGVVEADIPAMKALGYQVQDNRMRPGAEDSFWPKSIQPKEPKVARAIPDVGDLIRRLRLNADLRDEPTVASRFDRGLLREAADALEAALAAMGEREAVEAIRTTAEPPAPTPLTPSIPDQR